MSRLTDIQEISNHVKVEYKHPRNLSKKIQIHIDHPEQEISLFLYNFSKEVSKIIDWKTYKKFVTICINIPVMPPENLRKLAHSELEISKDNLISVRKWGNDQTDRHTRNLKLFVTNVHTSQECLQKIWES